MARAQGSQTSAQEDTVYLALTGTLETDLSQYLTDLTVSGAGAYETSSTRTTITGARTVSVRWTPTAAEVGKVVMICGNTAQSDYVWGITTEGAGKICMWQNAAGIWTATAAVAAKDYTISWSTRANPDTTGASDRRLSEVLIYNHTDSVITELAQFTHASPTSASGPYNLSVAGFWDGASLTNTPTNAPTKARVSTSHHPHTEAFEHWVGARTAYAGSAADGATEPTGPIPSSSGLGDESEFAGRHPWAYCAAHALQTARRSWSPLVNEVYNDEAALPTAVQAHWKTKAPGSTVYDMSIAWLRWVPVPEECTHAWVRIHIRQWVTESTAVKIGYRCYAFNRPPAMAQIANAPAPALKYHFAGGTSSVDDENGAGVWLELGYIRLPRLELEVTGWRGTVHLCLAYAVDPDSESGNDANARFIIDAWHVRPAIRDVAWHKVEL